MSSSQVQQEDKEFGVKGWVTLPAKLIEPVFLSLFNNDKSCSYCAAVNPLTEVVEIEEFVVSSEHTFAAVGFFLEDCQLFGYPISSQHLSIVWSALLQ